MNIHTKNPKTCILSRFFRGEKKQVILWARVILCMLEEYTKFKFLHFSSKYLEKSSPLPYLKKDWGFWVLDLCLKTNSPSAKVARGKKNWRQKKSAAKIDLNLRMKITRPNPPKKSNFFG
jgi:hypothetical protein